MCDHHDDTLDATGFEWDENKRLANIAKHGIDFEDALEVSLEPHRMKHRTIR